MKLIDADALADEREQFYDLKGEVAFAVRIEDIAVAPTVRCGECKYYGHVETYPSWAECEHKPSTDVYDEENDSLSLPDDFGCVYFERRMDDET